MKKTVLLVIAFMATTSLFAQKSAVNSAFSHYSNQYWDKAKASIDKACIYPETKDDAKTWMYKGNIYIMLASSKVEKYKKLCDNPLDEACEAFKTAAKLDPNIRTDKMAFSTPEQGLQRCSEMYYNMSVDEFNNKNFSGAALKAEKSFQCNPASEDAAYLYGYTSELAGDKQTAMKQYSTTIKLAKKNPKQDALMRLAALYQSENDTAKALRVIKMRSVLKDTTPLDKISEQKKENIVNYATIESVIYMWAGDIDKANQVMEKALALDPNNYVMLVNTSLKLIDQKNYDMAEDYLQIGRAHV